MNTFAVHLPQVFYGTAWKKERTADLVEKAVLSGFRAIDTACQPRHYNEPGVGQALERLKERGISRESLFVQTKFTPLAGQDLTTLPYDPSASVAEQVRQSLYISLKNLAVQYIDALLLHSLLPSHDKTMEAWHAMEALFQEGFVRRLGISNCYDLNEFKLIFQEASIKPTVVQNRFYSRTDYDKTLRKWSNENSISYQSFWTLTANPHILRHPFLVKLALSKQITVEQLFFRFLTQQQIIPLIGTCSEKHMKEDLAIFEFTLSEEEVRQINTCL